MPPLNIQCWIQWTSRGNIAPVHHHFSSYHPSLVLEQGDGSSVLLWRVSVKCMYIISAHNPNIQSPWFCPTSTFLVSLLAFVVNCFDSFSILQLHHFGCLNRDSDKTKSKKKAMQSIRTQSFSLVKPDRIRGKTILNPLFEPWQLEQFMEMFSQGHTDRQCRKKAPCAKSITSPFDSHNSLFNVLNNIVEDDKTISTWMPT